MTNIVLLFKRLSKKWQKRKTTQVRKKKKILDPKSKWERLEKERKAKREELQVVMLEIRKVTLKSLEVWVLVMLTHAHPVHSMSKISSS